MKRREFITLLGGAAVAWPIAARAQQAAMPVIGSLDSRRPGRRGPSARISPGPGRRPAMRGRERDDRIPLGRKSNRSVASAGRRSGSPTGRRDRHGRGFRAFAAKAATTTIPIVFVLAEDPVRVGLVASLARPGGNPTGINFFNTELRAKRLELPREFVPAAADVAVFVNPTGPPDTETTERDMEAAARAMGLQIQMISASTSREINAAFATFVRERPDALFVADDPFSLAGVSNWRSLRRATRSPRHLGRATLPKPAG